MKFVGIVTLLMASSFSFGAGSTPSEQTGTIKSIQALNDGRTIVFMETARSEKPSCATYPYWFISNENSAAGKTQISILLAAHAAKRSVTIKGTGTCSRWSDGEDISSVEIL
ncbi:MAG: hypothetical protein ACI8SR_002946 [Oceanicoccus sp.]|jgi:hypothetical protein